MPRMARAVLPDAPHHITQRGIRRFNVFLDEEDRRTYLELFRENCHQFGLRICSYCLMTNHVHFVAIPKHMDSIWKTFHRCHSIYARRFNQKYGLTGHLWQGRPFSCVLDEAHRWAAVRYVELNPVRARMVGRAEEYPWSSARAHCGLGNDPLLDAGWPPPKTIEDWKAWLLDDNDVTLERSIREHTFTGRPCGDDAFVRTVEQALHRSWLQRSLDQNHKVGQRCRTCPVDQ